MGLSLRSPNPKNDGEIGYWQVDSRSATRHERTGNRRDGDRRVDLQRPPRRPAASAASSAAAVTCKNPYRSPKPSDQPSRDP